MGKVIIDLFVLQSSNFFCNALEGVCVDITEQIWLYRVRSDTNAVHV